MGYTMLSLAPLYKIHNNPPHPNIVSREKSFPRNIAYYHFDVKINQSYDNCKFDDLLTSLCLESN